MILVKVMKIIKEEWFFIFNDWGDANMKRQQAHAKNAIDTKFQAI